MYKSYVSYWFWMFSCCFHTYTHCTHMPLFIDVFSPLHVLKWISVLYFHTGEEASWHTCISDELLYSLNLLPLRLWWLSMAAWRHWSMLCFVLGRRRMLLSQRSAPCVTSHLATRTPNWPRMQYGCTMVSQLLSSCWGSRTTGLS